MRRLEDFRWLRWYKDELTSRNRDFYRCYSCGRMFTREQELALMARLSRTSEEDQDVSVCGCGSKKYVPSRFSWADILRPSVLKYVVKLVLARGLAPWLDKVCPKALPIIDRLARPAGWYNIE